MTTTEMQRRDELDRVRDSRRKQRARDFVKRAIRSGTLTPGACERADDSCRGPIEAHHPDYDKVLDVQWLCRSHRRRGLS